MSPRIQKLRKRLGIATLALAAAVLTGWYGLPWLVPLPDGIFEKPASPVILDRHGEPLHRLTLPDHTRRSPVPLADLPPDLIACTLAAEDKRFRDHGGIDFLATARSARDWARNGSPVSGASTITQQLVKLSSPPAPRTLRTKVREWLVARRLEMSWSKDEILQAYFDHLDYGDLRIGPEAAARHFFGKSLAHLSLGECALLAGLPQAPSRLNPVRHPERALERREVVIDRLAAATYETPRISRARKESLRLATGTGRPSAPWLPASVAAMPGPINTTIDANLQRDIEAIVREELAPLADANLQHAAVVVIDNPTGDILALVSSADWSDPRGGQINGALTPRSPGSALKPFTYLLAFERSGRFPGSIVADIPTRFRTLEDLDAPVNFDRKFRGPVTIRDALACSLNVPAMRELNRLGGPEPLASLLAEMDVLASPDVPDAGLGLTIGNKPVTLLSLTNAYATLARGGRYFRTRLLLDSGTDLEKRIFTERDAWLVADILADPEARAPAFGRRGPLELPFPCAAKTGTSSDFRDNWCLGFTDRFTVGVWAGNFDNSPMEGLSGIAGAGPVFHRTMLRLQRDEPAPRPPAPGGLIAITIDARNGKTVPPGSPFSRREWCPVDAVPNPATSSDYAPDGRALLDDSYAEWLASSDNRRTSEFAPRPDRPAESPLRILAPRPNATYLLDPELPNGGRLHLASNLPGLVTWSSDSLSLVPSKPEPVAILTPGKHTLRAVDPRTGQATVIEIDVQDR